jgi:hypothetical protein
MAEKKDDDAQPKGGPNPSDPMGDPQPAGPNASHPALDTTLTAQTAQYDPERSILSTIANPAGAAVAAEAAVEAQMVAGANVDPKAKAKADVDPLKMEEARTEAAEESPQAEAKRQAEAEKAEKKAEADKSDGKPEAKKATADTKSADKSD